MSPGHQPWTKPKGERAPPQLIGVPRSVRSVDVLNIAWGSRPAKRRKFPWYCDYTQCISRKSYGPTAKCLTKTTRVYDFKRDTIILPGEAWQMQGLPTPGTAELLCDLEATPMFKLAGQGFFCPSIGTILLALFLNPEAPWWPATPEELD